MRVFVQFLIDDTKCSRAALGSRTQRPSRPPEAADHHHRRLQSPDPPAQAGWPRFVPVRFGMWFGFQGRFVSQVWFGSRGSPVHAVRSRDKKTETVRKRVAMGAVVRVGMCVGSFRVGSVLVVPVRFVAPLPKGPLGRPGTSPPDVLRRPRTFRVTSWGWPQRPPTQSGRPSDTVDGINLIKW